MVRTRHATDADVDDQETFLSLDSRKSRLGRRLLPHDDESDDSGVVQFNREHGSSRRMRQRAAAKRVSYVEDFIDDYPDRQTRRSRHSQPDDEEEEFTGRRQLDGTHLDGTGDIDYSPCKRQTRARTSLNKSLTDEDEEEPQSPVRKTRRTADFLVTHPSPRTSKEIKMEQLADIEDRGIRRSSRTKNDMTDLLNKEYDQTEEPKPKRRRPDPDNVGNNQEGEDGEFTDMYSRVKRKRKRVKRFMFSDEQEDNGEEGEEEEEEEDGEESEEEEEEDENGGGNGEEEGKDEPSRRSYYLRENKPRTNFYNVIPETRRTRSRFYNDDDVSPRPRTHRRAEIYMSPARRRVVRNPRRRTAFHGSSSTSSASSDSSSDEERFQKRKAKSMKKSRQRCLPMNFDLDDLTKSSVLRDRQKIGSSLADVDPMSIDRSITFASVGGLGKHVRALKEMVVFPLLYPEIFERFKISPPRGVLFYGPPGTGKTLVARALANECSKDDRRVAFYMRKGADCLSKWVGESERQLRLLFDQAYQTRPSIIFFDEIDGLAPVRSSRQDQIHSSIVSTLLALMDGLDSRGEVVVIGATNRIDSIDPALRRPGRFDREFLFPLPSLQARSHILKIQTKEWNPSLSEKFVVEVAEKCIGYCGADMKALCTEAALLALRRRYPQIYTSTEKLQIDVSSIQISSKDFYHGMQNIVPTSQRSITSPARALSTHIQSLLQAQLTHLLAVLNDVFPSVINQLANLDNDASKTSCEDQLEVYSDDEGNDASIYEQKSKGRRKSTIPKHQGKFFDFISYATKHPSTHRPRLMLLGKGDQGQSSHIAPAILHHLEQLPVHVLDLPALFAVNARSPEESCAQIFREARRTSPSVVYMPHINQWWNVVGDTVKTTLMTLIQDLDPSSPLLLLATSEEDYADIDFSVQDLFDEYSGEVVTMRNPNQEERQAYFKDLLLYQTTIPPVIKASEDEVLEELPKAPPPEPRQLTEIELKKLHDHEEGTLTELRIFLRDVLNKLGRDRKFWIFTKPVDIEDVPDYYEIISKPMDLSTMMSKIDLHHYITVKEFMVDINLICTNALEYNPDRDVQSRIIRHRACALRDTANAIIKAELDKDFEKVCQGISNSRKKRGVGETTTAPSFYHTRPLNQGPMHPLAITRKPTPTTSQQSVDSNLRSSRRLHGRTLDNGPSLEEVEKTARAVRSMIRNSPKKENENTPQAQVRTEVPQSSDVLTTSQESKHSGQLKAQNSGSKPPHSGSSSTKKSVKKSIWGRSSYKRRRKKRNIKRELDEDEGLVDLEDQDDDQEEEDSEEEMDEEDSSTNKQSNKSPSHSLPGNRSPKHVDNQEAADSHDMSEKSSQGNSLNQCLTVDVNMKSPQDVPRTPSQRSPRLDSHKHVHTQSNNEQINGVLPKGFSDDTTPRLNKSDLMQKSPRQRQVSDSRSQRSSDNPHPTESDNKALRHKSHDSDRQTGTNVIPKGPASGLVNEEELTNISATNTGDTGDVVPVVVNGFDSGIGSSDSGGDSNDSAGKLIAGSVSTSQDMATGKTTEAQQVVTATTSKEESQDVDMNESEGKQGSPKLRVTRSMLQSKQTDSQTEPKVTVLIDKERVSCLLSTSVTMTENYTVSQLEKLYSIFAQCIYQHRTDLDKTQLLEVMERRLRQYTNNISRKMLEQKDRLRV